LKNGRKRGESKLKIGCQNALNFFAKNALKMYLFMMMMHVWNASSIHISLFHCLLMNSERMAKEGDFLSEFWLSLQ